MARPRPRTLAIPPEGGSERGGDPKEGGSEEGSVSYLHPVPSHNAGSSMRPIAGP